MKKEMTATQFQAALDKIGISQMAFARHIEKDDRTVRRWVSGESVVPALVAHYVRELVKRNAQAEELA
jgi:DNA-binding transcriptional regulator YiaG